MSSPTPPQPRLFWAMDDEAVAARARAMAAGGKAAAAAAATAPRGLKLIDVNKGKLVLAQQGTAALRSLPVSAPLNLCFIFGSARSGKSFLMNCLSGTPGLFQVMNSSSPCTKGVDLASTILPLRAFAAHADSLPVQLEDIELGAGGVDGEANQQTPASPMNANGASSPRTERIDVEAAAAAISTQVGFVDVEGQGAEDGTYDTMLALPLLMTSKVVLFNHKGAPTVSDMLSKLGVLARAADYIDLGADEDAEEEDTEEKSQGQGQPASPRQNSLAGQMRSARAGKKFGHLHVLFRDFSFAGDVHSVYQQLMGMEPLAQVKPAKGPKSSLKDGAGASSFSKADRDRELDANKAIQERNDIRALLLDNFQSIHIWLLKQPASADVLKAHKELPEELVDPEFTREINRLSVVLAAQMKAPAHFAGQVLTGTRVATLLSQITTALNTSGAISVPSVFRAMEDEAVHRVFTEVVARQDAKLSKLSAAFPISKPTLIAQIDGLFRRSLDEYDTELADCVLMEEKTKQRAELIALQGKAREVLVASNQDLLLRFLKKTFTDATAAAKARFEQYCQEHVPVEDARLLEQEFAAVRQSHKQSVAHALSPFPEASELSEYRFTSLESDESLTEFLQLKLLSNDTQVKAHKIEKLQDEAIKQQQLLVEQNRRLEEFLSAERQNTQQMEQELLRLRAERDNEHELVTAEQQRIAELQKQLEEIKAQKKKKKDCVIL